MFNQTSHDRWFNENYQENRTTAVNIIKYNYMRKLQICNYNEFKFHISVINTINDSLYDEFRARK